MEDPLIKKNEGGIIIAKKIIIFLILTAFVILLFSLYRSNLNNNKLSNKIIEYIDNNAENNTENNTCILSMRDITEFTWDKMLIYQVGSSNIEISEILGVGFEDSIDLSSGMIFIYEDKIVYKESMLYNPDQLSNRLFYVDHGQPQYMEFTPNDAIFDGNRKETDDNSYYYIIVPSNIN